MIPPVLSLCLKCPSGTERVTVKMKSVNYKEQTLDHNNELIDSKCDLPRSSTVGDMMISSQFLRNSTLCQRSMTLVCESEGEGMKDLMYQLTLASG
jgi:hypothetical protein